MAIPTFDFSNIFRFALKGVLKLVSQPITFFTVLMVSGGTLFSMLYNYFFGLTIPTIPASLTMPYYDNGSGVTDFFYYMLNVDTLLTIFNYFINALNTLIQFLPGLLLGLIIAIRIYQVKKHVYYTVKGMSSSS